MALKQLHCKQNKDYCRTFYKKLILLQFFYFKISCLVQCFLLAKSLQLVSECKFLSAPVFLNEMSPLIINNHAVPVRRGSADLWDAVQYLCSQLILCWNASEMLLMELYEHVCDS